jgi:hypothetical protein
LKGESLMKRTCLLVAVLACTAIISHHALAGDVTGSNAYFSLNLEFNDPSDFSSGGTWTTVGKVDEFGLAGVSMVLVDANFDESTGFLAPDEYALQQAFFFDGMVLNVGIGDDGQGPPLLGVGVIGSNWPSDYEDDPNLAQFGGYPDLGSFTGGVALATGTFDPGVVPDWTLHPGIPEPTLANLYSSSGFPVVAAVTHLTVRNVVPEPSAIVLAVMGLMGTAVGRRRR